MEELKEILGKLDLTQYDRVTVNITQVIYSAPTVVQAALPPKAEPLRRRRHLETPVQTELKASPPKAKLYQGPPRSAFKPASHM